MRSPHPGPPRPSAPPHRSTAPQESPSHVQPRRHHIRNCGQATVRAGPQLHCNFIKTPISTVAHRGVSVMSISLTSSPTEIGITAVRIIHLLELCVVIIIGSMVAHLCCSATRSSCFFVRFWSSSSFAESSAGGTSHRSTGPVMMTNVLLLQLCAT